jgi:hypothetical protein
MGNAAILVDLLLGLLDRANAIGALISKAKAEGRDVTDAELDALVAQDDAARAALVAAIAKARTPSPDSGGGPGPK